jgi:ribulose-phosphate 3-epimerase
MTKRIQPSILSADFVNFERDFATISAADGIHVDVMDGHFVPNLTFGLGMVKRMQEITELPLDVHLMIEDADRWGPTYADAGVFSVTVHYEAVTNAVGTAKSIRSAGSRAGLSIKPNTEVEQIADLVQHFDQILVMSVEPGFGGQSFMPLALEKIAAVKKLVEAKGLNTWIQVDGGIDLATIKLASASGADTFVAGSSVFAASDRNAMISQLREAAESAVSSL